MRTEIRLRIEALRQAADGLQAALLAGGDLAGQLEQFAQAAGADGAVILRDLDTVWQEIVHSPGIEHMVRPYLAGMAPPDSRSKKVKLSRTHGFIADFHSFTADEIARDAYYQDFLRGHGLGWHAAASLIDQGRAQTVMSLKRSPRQGHYEKDELELLDQVLPLLRETASFAHALGRAEVAGQARGLARDGSAYQLDDHLRCRATSLPEAGENQPVIFVDGKPQAARPEEQAALDAALGKACRRPFNYAALLLTARDGRARAIVRLAPVVGSATSLFRDVHVMMVVTPLGQRREPAEELVPALINLFQLTKTEARVAALVGCGWVPREAARQLEISEGTLRNHLKSSFGKMGVSRQMHLTQLVAAVGAG